MSKIDTQGMSGESTEGCTDNVYPRDENGEPIYPPFNPTPLTLIEPQLRIELKELIMECLREWVQETEYLHQPTEPEGRYYCSKSDCEGVRFSESSE